MLTISSTLKLIIARTLPLMVGLFSIMLVQLVDSIFIGQLGIDELAVHGMTLSFQTVLVGIQVGIGVAATREEHSFNVRYLNLIARKCR